MDDSIDDLDAAAFDDLDDGDYDDDAEPWDEQPALAAATLTVQAALLVGLAAVAVGAYLLWRRRRRA